MEARSGALGSRALMGRPSIYADRFVAPISGSMDSRPAAASM